MAVKDGKVDRDCFFSEPTCFFCMEYELLNVLSQDH